MKKLEINGKEYTLEYSFESAEDRDCVQAIFKMLSGAYVAQRAVGLKEDDEVGAGNAIIDGMTEMVSDIPHVVNIAFKSGLLEKHEGIDKDEAKKLLRAYMKETKTSYNGMYELIKDCMEDDGFFDLSGLTEMLQSMNGVASQKADEITAKKNQKKQTSTK